VVFKVNGFWLGLANGTICLATCAPVLAPYLLGEGKGIRGNYRDLALFLSGRLLGYLLFGFLAWCLNRFVLESFKERELIYGISYVLLAGLMFFYSLRKVHSKCAAEAGGPLLKKFSGRWVELLPAVMGFLTGLNLCPPFLLAFTNAAASGNLGQSLLFFLAFFAGTSLYFVPVPLLGALKRFEALRFIGRVTAGLVGLYYLVYGIIIIFGGSIR
jgi:sulfite exporter TauE/SafE